MHYFVSQYISTVKVVDESPDGATFRGHYLYGDGASLFLISPAAFALMLVLLSFDASSMLLNVTVLLAGIVLALVFCHLIIFRVRIEFHYNANIIMIRTIRLTGVKREQFKSDQVQLEVLNIHIRLAQDCGAVDLVLPKGKIRIMIDGRYDQAIMKAKVLSSKTGIALKL